MRKGYLVELNYHDGSDYEPMTDKWMIAVFENKEDAEKFCRNNSDDKYYFIREERTIQFGDQEPIKAIFGKWDHDDVNCERYWFDIYEVDIV